jgi:hypothetical protein
MARSLPEPKDAYEGGEAAIFNAESLLESAKAAAGADNYGAAVAFVVLALEEAVKARALFGFLLANKSGMAVWPQRPCFSRHPVPQARDPPRPRVHAGHVQ